MFRFIAVVALFAAPSSVGESATSPDGRWRAEIRVERQATTERGGSSAVWLIDTRTGKHRKLYVGPVFRGSFWGPRWSPDQRIVYFSKLESETSAGTHQINVRTGEQKLVFDGGLMRVMRTGPYRGYLLAQPHRYREAGGSYNPIVLVRQDGKEILTVPGSDEDDGARSLGRWLLAKGWAAS